MTILNNAFQTRSVTVTTESRTNGATTLSRTNLPGYVGHVTIFRWMLIIVSYFVVRLELGLDLVSGWIMVIHTHSYYFWLWLSHSLSSTFTRWMGCDIWCRFMSDSLFCVDVVDTTIAELIKDITDSDDFMNSLAVEQGMVLTLFVCGNRRHFIRAKLCVSKLWVPEDYARLTLLRFSSVGRAPTSATEPSVLLDLESGTICRWTSDSRTCSTFRQSWKTFSFGQWDQSAVWISILFLK